MAFGTTIEEYLRMAASVNMFSIANNYKNKTNVKVAGSNANIYMYLPFSKQWILVFCVTIVHRKISADLTGTSS